MLVCGVVLAGCQARINPTRNMRMTYRLIEGQQRLFSTFGFWIFDEPLRTRLLEAYEPDGRLNRARLRALLPDARISENPEWVRLTVPDKTLPEIIVLSDERMISVDPKMDPAVLLLFETFNRTGQPSRFPIVVPLGGVGPR